MTEPEFDLIGEPWIEVLDGNCDVVSVGLADVFARAHEFKSLYGDSAAQDVAVMRLLLAVMYAVFLRGSVLKTEEDAYALWADLYSAGRFETGPIMEYLETNRDRFWLFHEDHPFYQCKITCGTRCSADKLDGNLSETASKPRLFRMSSGNGRGSMAYADAARWLLYLNAYDDTSMKPSIRGGSMPSAGTGWLGRLGLVYAEGGNLFETLMLNFPLSDRGRRPMRDGTAPWEREPDTTERVVIDTPDNPLEMLTLQSRRILLEREGGRVTGYTVTGGDIVEPESCLIEQMTEWRENRYGKVVPKRHDPGRSMWRDFSSLLLDAGAGPEKRIKPGVIRWVSGLTDRGIPIPRTIRFHAAGVVYADRNFFVTDLVDDSLFFGSGFLAETNEVWRIRLCDLVSSTDRCVLEAARLASRIMDCSGADESVRKRRVSSVKSSLFTRLDAPFRTWLASTDPEGFDMDGASEVWMKTLERIVLDFGDGLLEDAGGKAFRGTGDSFGSNAFSALDSFRKGVFRITRCLP